MHKVFCLLSGGIDSSTTLAIARDEFPNDKIEAITVNYGQRHLKEMDYAIEQVRQRDARHSVLDLRGILTGMLVEKGDANEKIPDVSYADLPEGISPTYVSFRNGTMLSLLAARAQSWIMEMDEAIYAHQAVGALGSEKETEPTATIYIGVHADDGVNWAYPDCTPEFIGGMANAIYIGTYMKVRLRAPLLFMDKPAVVREGSRLGVDFANTWSCYKGEELQCGTCPTCRSRREAFDLNGLQDPVEYANAS